MSLYDKAKACFLAAIRASPEIGDAYVGLAMNEQLVANEMIRRQNFGIAEESLAKAEQYVTTALKYDTTNPRIHTQLGYVYKDLAQRYIGTPRAAKAHEFTEKAAKHFKMTLALDDNSASAHNGLGNVHMLQGDYDRAIDLSGKATELAPEYLFAFFDLAMAYYAKYRATQTRTERIKAIRGFFEACKEIGRISSSDGATPEASFPQSLPPAALRSLTQIMNWMQRESDKILES